MNKKVTMGLLIIMTICFVLLGIICLSTANNHKGTSVKTMTIINGETRITDSGTIGGDSSRMKQFKAWGTGCFILAGVCGVTCVIVKIADKH